MRDLSEPHTRTLPGPRFQQEASIDYRRDDDATPQAVSDGGMMIESML